VSVARRNGGPCPFRGHDVGHDSRPEPPPRPECRGGLPLLSCGRWRMGHGCVVATSRKRGHTAFAMPLSRRGYEGSAPYRSNPQRGRAFRRRQRPVQPRHSGRLLRKPQLVSMQSWQALKQDEGLCTPAPAIAGQRNPRSVTQVVRTSGTGTTSLSWRLNGAAFLLPDEIRSEGNLRHLAAVGPAGGDALRRFR
jgi:hypothetical protein